MKIAVIGSGIAGMSAAHTLAAQQHEVHLYEASARLGGHTATLDVDDNGKQLAVDTGFIVYNVIWSRRAFGGCCATSCASIARPNPICCVIPRWQTRLLDITCGSFTTRRNSVITT